MLELLSSKDVSRLHTVTYLPFYYSFLMLTSISLVLLKHRYSTNPVSSAFKQGYAQKAYQDPKFYRSPIPIAREL